jgi:hypothetical protein
LPGTVATNLVARSDYWLGVYASRPSPALQAQLKLSKDQGLLVEELQPESPAAKAGLQQYDILLKGNDKPLGSLEDLMQLIDRVKEGKLTLDLLRAGKPETVTVTPAKRPANEAGLMGELRIPESTTFSGVIRNETGGPTITVVRPGAQILPAGPMTARPAPMTMEVIVRAKASLADGSKVEITRRDGEPLRVVVTRDKDKWEGTFDDLSKIPEKLRPEVEKLLHWGFDQIRILATAGGPGGPVMAFGGGPEVVIGGTVLGGAMPAPAAVGFPLGFAGPGIALAPDVDKRLGEMQKQLDAIRHRLDSLQGTSDKPKSE